MSLANATQADMITLEEIRQLVNDDIKAVDQLIQQRLRSDVALINQLSHYIINSGGKRLRPLLVLLSARACGYKGKEHIDLSAIIEFIHTATLMHDDVVDASALRRGKDTANSIWGNEASVLVGDFLYSRAFEMMVETGSMRIMAIMAQATNIIAEGEVLQLLNCNDASTTEQRYLDVIHCKTAKLFEAATQLGAVLARGDAAVEQAMQHYGMHLGTAFQLVDDILDYSADAAQIGKNIGDDLAEGKPTLPLIYAMSYGTRQQRDLIKTAIEQGGREHMQQILAAIEATGALAYTTRTAAQESEKAVAAIACLPASRYKDALVALAQFALQRTH